MSIRAITDRRKQSVSMQGQSQGRQKHEIDDDNKQREMEQKINNLHRSGIGIYHPHPILMLHYSRHTINGHNEHDGGYGLRRIIKKNKGF